MRKIIGMVLCCLVACSLFLIVQPAFGALQSNIIWNPKEGTEQLTINLKLDDGYSFGIYDYDMYTTQLTIFTGSGSYTDWTTLLNELHFDDDGSNWSVYLANDADNAINLGATNDFGFFFKDTAGEIYDNYTYELVSETVNGQTQESYVLTWKDNNITVATMYVGVHDVYPTIMPPGTTPTVPIPTAMLLFGSGLVGLAGFKRKMDN